MDGSRRWAWAGIGFLAAAYAAIILANTCFFFGGPDAAGYGSAAKLFDRGQVRIAIDAPKGYIYCLTPLGFSVTEGTTIVPFYPPGTPVHLLIAARIGGWKIAPFLVSPLLAFATLLLVVLIGRELGLPPLWGAGAALIVALLPPFISHAVQPVSDVIATFWAALTIWLCLRALQRPALAFAAGVAFSIGVTVRPTNLLVALPLAFALRWRFPLLWRAVAGAIPVAAAYAVYNNALYGEPWKFGYGTPAAVLSLAMGPACFRFFTGWLMRMATPLVLPGGLLVVFDRAANKWHRTLLAVWFLSFFGFYTFYGCDEWYATRFLLPGFAPLALGLMILLRDMRVPRVVAPLLIAIIAGFEWRATSRVSALQTDDHHVVYRDAVLWAAPRLPKDALVLSGVLSGTFYFYDDRITLRWDQLDPDITRLFSGRRMIAVISPKQECDQKELERRTGMKWRSVGTYEDFVMWEPESPSRHPERSEGSQNATSSPPRSFSAR